jgi:hypothetical protein
MVRQPSSLRTRARERGTVLRAANLRARARRWLTCRSSLIRNRRTGIAIEEVLELGEQA